MNTKFSCPLEKPPSIPPRGTLINEIVCITTPTPWRQQTSALHILACRYVSFEAEDLPDTFDWRDKDVVSSVKDQGTVGTCWAFSTIGNVEGQWALAGHLVISLATEQLVDCDATIDSKKCDN